MTYNISGGTFTGSVGPASGHASITTTTTVVSPALLHSLNSLADQVARLAGEMGIPAEDVARLQEAAAELKTESSKPVPEPPTLKLVVGTIRRIAEGAAGNIVASGVLQYIAALPW